MKVRAKLIDLWKKVTPFKTQDNVYWNGEDNNYSEEMERVVGNSPTGSRAKEMFTKFIFGKGIDDVKLSNDTYLSGVAKDVIDDVVVQNGAYIHTSFKIDTTPDNDVIFVPYIPKSLDYNKCRISNDDDDGNKGMILYKIFNKHDKSLTKKEKDYSKKYYPFNYNQEVIKAQIISDAKGKVQNDAPWVEKIKHYRGQVMYLNLTPKYTYAISKFDSVFNDLDTEYRIGVYINTMTRGGFLGKTAILTQGLDTEQDEQIKDDVQKWLGSGGSNGAYYLSVEQADSLDDVLKVIQVPSQFDDKQFETIRKSLRINILGAANNLPPELAFSDTSSMFDSGEKYIQLKKFYWEQCEFERQSIEKAFYKLGYNINFKPIYDVDSNNAE